MSFSLQFQNTLDPWPLAGESNASTQAHGPGSPAPASDIPGDVEAMDDPCPSTESLSRQTRIVSSAADIDRRLDALMRRDDARFFSAETQEIRERVKKALRLGRQPDGGWQQAGYEINGARTWLRRLESDLKRMDDSTVRWQDLVTERRALPDQALAEIEQRAFWTARFMATNRCCSRRGATAMARRAEQALRSGCPATSALVNERVRRALRGYPDGIVDPLVRMLRMDSAAKLDDGLAVLRALTRLPAAMASQLADAGVTLHPSPEQLASALPRLHGAAGNRCNGLFCAATKRLLVKTICDPTTGTRTCRPRVPLHEAAHAYVTLPGAITDDDPEFISARRADIDEGRIEVGRDDYFRKSTPDLGTNPVAETFAESLSMYLLGNRRWSALHAYWGEQFKSGRMT